MSRLLAACAVLAFAFPVSAADEKPKPNTLTPKEIANGWILLFDGETSFGWLADSRPGAKGVSQIEPAKMHGAIRVGGENEKVAYQSVAFADYEMTFEVSRKGLSKATLGMQIVYTVEGGGDGTSMSSRDVDQMCEANGDWASVKIKAAAGPNNTYSYQVNEDKPVSTRPNPKVGLSYLSRMGIKVSPGGEMFLRNVKLRPLNTKPLFDGKSLDGWAVNKADPKRVASKFEVTKAGELSVKDGPGDLVTAKEFDNFVLQFECKTLGEALNSGIFFRCIPGEYQNGYEAQIQNAFLDKDRTKPKDFGTGAIYRRVPARKVVSDDNAWFTMTLVADGKHFSTWVNGYQTVDWTDDRAADANPRKGYRSAKGPLSIQGHDTTTDLLFRNIRVAELVIEKKEK